MAKDWTDELPNLDAALDWETSGAELPPKNELVSAFGLFKPPSSVTETPPVDTRFNMPVPLVTVFRLDKPTSRLEGKPAFRLNFALNRDPLRYYGPDKKLVELKNPVRFRAPVRAQFWARYAPAEGYPSGGVWVDSAGRSRVEMDTGGAWTRFIAMGGGGTTGEPFDGTSGNTISLYWVPNEVSRQFHIGVNLTIHVNVVWVGVFSKSENYYPISRGPVPARGQRFNGDQYGRLNVLGPLPPE